MIVRTFARRLGKLVLLAVVIAWFLGVKPSRVVSSLLEIARADAPRVAAGAHSGLTPN